MPQESRYEVLEDAHGEGRFGKIQKQRDTVLDRLVAVKELKLFDDSEARERFIREAKTLAKMSHPNVPSIYDVEFLADSMKIYFQFIQGDDLRKIISEGVIPTIEQVRRWFLQVASALEHAHGLGIVHRDVKPDNIVVSADRSSAALVDFGIAFTQDDVGKLTATGYVIGSAAYMSPEQASGEELNGRSDLYSLGVTLYEVLSGHLPHPGQYQCLSDVNEAIPPAVDDLIQKCLVRDRAHRIADAREFAQELDETTRTDIPLSSLLTDARLHEILAALGQLSPDEFHSKPHGQKLLILNRLKDLLRTDKKELRFATAQMVILLIRHTMFEAKDYYEFIARASFSWGFDKDFGATWQGNPDIRNALISAVKQVPEPAHEVLSSEFLKFITDNDLGELPGWYHHDLRKIVVGLLANPSCGTAAPNLASFYDKLNQATH